MFETGNSLKGYLQRESKEHQIHSNYAYNYYFSRYLLELLYDDPKTKLVLKGSYAQYANVQIMNRPFTDIDIITSHKMEIAKESIDRVLGLNGKIKFKILNNFTTTNATLNYKILGTFDDKTSRISLDLKRENPYDPKRIELPKVFSKDDVFDVNTISVEEHLASKLYVILLHLKLYKVLGRDFRRFKDFFDVHHILGNSIIDERKVFEILTQKIKEDEFLRDYELDGPLFPHNFIKDNQEQWNKDKSIYNYLNDATFEESVEATKEVIRKR